MMLLSTQTPKQKFIIYVYLENIDATTQLYLLHVSIGIVLDAAAALCQHQSINS
jgi:hypothetical protein